MKPLHGVLAVLVTLIWGINFSVIKLGLATIDPLILAGLRFGLCALPAIFFVREPDVPRRFIILYGLVFGVGLWGMVNLGIQAGLSAGIASLVLQFSAFFTLLLGGVVFKEALTRFQVLGMLIASTGLLCIIKISGGLVSWPGLAFVLAGAACWSIANTIVKKAQTNDVFGFLVWSSAVAPVPLFILDYAMHGGAGYGALLRQMNSTAVFSLLFQVYPNTLFAYWIWNSLLKTYPLSTIAPLSLLVPIFGLVGSVLVFGERLTAGIALAATLIMLGLVVGLYGRRLVIALLARARAA